MLFSGLEEAAKSAGVNLRINRVGSMGAIFFTKDLVTDFASAKASDGEKFKKYYSNMGQTLSNSLWKGYCHKFFCDCTVCISDVGFANSF